MLGEVMFETGAWLATMRSPAEPLRVPRVGELVDELLAAHDRGAALDPELYALVAIAEGATPGQQQRALFALLAASRTTLAADLRVLVDRVIAVLFARLSDDHVIGTLLALRRRRENHKHATRAIARWVLLYPRGELLVARRRSALRDIIEHAFGRNVARACAKHVATPSVAGAAYLARSLHRLVGTDAQVEARFAAIMAKTLPPGIVRAPDTATAPVADDSFVPPKTVTATNRGDIAATLVHVYRGGDSDLLRRGLADYVDDAARRLPILPGRVALVVDASLSTLGYGDRQYCCISQSWALALVLGKRCEQLDVKLAGGRAEAGAPPRPEGATDLVTPLLDAVAAGADIVAIVTDGYENRLGGELAGVLAALPRAGIATPVVIVNSKFTHKDDLALRRLAPAALSIDMWHEHDFRAVVETIGCAMPGAAGRAFVQRALGDRLSQLEKASPPWPPPSLPSH